MNTKEINNIEVINPEILTPMEAIDLSKLSAKELKEELARRELQKDQDREAYKELVRTVMGKAVTELCFASQTLTKAKTKIFQIFEDALKLKASVYGIKEKQMSHTFSTDNAEITIGYRINDAWDDTVNTGIAKVENFINSLATDEKTAALVNMVFNLLKKDAKGNLKGSRVLELQKLTKDFNNEEFTDGVNIISEAYKPVRSVWFIEASMINADGSKTSIPLALSSVEFEAGYTFDFYKNEENGNRD